MLKRIWTKNTIAMRPTKDTLSIWDAGDIRYERASNGQEHSWKVVDRQITDTGFIEVLEELQLYETPTNIVWKEVLPVILEKGGFQIPEWSVKYIVSGAQLR
jgi:hypothetical protein